MGNAILKDERITPVSAAGRYIAAYLSLETQSAEDASTDSQMATVALSLSERIGSAKEGAVIDLGCGQGALLQRLSEISQFRDNPSWIYIGIDDEYKLTSVQELARKLKLNRRVEVFNLDEFYDTWPDVPEFQIIVCRNVLHELRILDTARLIHHIATSARSTDAVLGRGLISAEPQAH